MQHEGMFGALPEKFSHPSTVASYAASGKNAATGTTRYRTDETSLGGIMGERIAQKISYSDLPAGIELESVKRALPA